MAVEEQSLREVAFDLGENEGCVSLVFDDFTIRSFDAELIDPVLDMQCSFFQLAIGVPLLIKSSGQVINFDEISERGDDLLFEVSFDILLKFLDLNLLHQDIIVKVIL